MGLWSWLFGQFIDVIEWTDDSQDTMVWRFPRQGNEIKYGAKLIVRESQMAVFVNEGEIADLLTPGTYELETNNLPILTTLQHWDHGFKSPFKAEVYFVNTKRFTDLKWGTKGPIMVRDPEFSMVRLRAFGTYEIQIADPKAFLREIVGTDGHFTIDEVDAQLSNIIVSKLATVLGKDDTSILDLAANYEMFSEHITKGITPYFSEYGLKLTKILVENISLPEDVQKAIDQRTSREITGNLDAHLKYQTGKAMGNTGSTMGDMVGMGAGLAIGQQMAESMSKPAKVTTPPPPPSPENTYVSIGGKADGPHDRSGLKELVEQGYLDRDTYIWRQDFKGWKKAYEVLPELFDHRPPPVPS